MIGERISKIRKEHNLTIAELARRSKVDEKTIRQIEKNARNPKNKTLEALAKAMGITLTELTGRDPSDYKLREQICDGCYYWRRISAYGDVKKICHFAHDGKGTAVVNNGKGRKLDIIKGFCPNKRKGRKSNGRVPYSAKKT